MIFNISDKPRRNVLVNTDHGLMIINRFDCDENQVGHGQWLLDHGNVSTVEAHNCYSVLKDIPNPVIFDIGANIGTFTTWMSNAFPTGKIYAFEPQRSVFQMLCGNISINNLYNVYTHNLALGKENYYVEFDEPNYFAKNDYGTFSLVETIIEKTTQEKIIVQVQTLDSFIETHKIKSVNLLKIDVEGMDMDVLLGASQTIRKFHPYIFIEHNDNRKSILNEIQTHLKKYGYSFEVIGNNLLAK
jgi:FkbM family methyltransferase